MTGNDLYRLDTDTATVFVITLKNTSGKDTVYRVDINDSLYKLVYIMDTEEIVLNYIGELFSLKITDIYKEENAI